MDGVAGERADVGTGSAPDPTREHPTLFTPARARVIDLAADVLAGLPVEDVPASLRAIARFTPAKRARLGSTAIAAALDGDEAFRTSVADTVRIASPELVEQVADAAGGAALPVAADPVDIGVVAYLTRPDDWPAVLREAATRWHDGQRGSDPAAGELAGARAEVARLRAEVRGEAARTREAVAQASGALAHDLDEARRALRRTTGELREAQRAVAAAQREADEARAELAAARAAAATERAAAREARVEAGRVAEAARRDVRTAREMDDARLWLLTDTLVKAAAGLRQELALAPPSRRPADGVTGEDASSRPAAVDGPGLDGLLGLPNVHLIVDGYNVTKTGYPDLALADQRARLIGALAALAARLGIEVTAVFDGATRPPVQPAVPRGVRVLFSAADEIADDVIRRLVAAEPAGRPLVVVSSDQAVARDVARDGARTVASSAFLARLR